MKAIFISLLFVLLVPCAYSENYGNFTNTDTNNSLTPQQTFNKSELEQAFRGAVIMALKGDYATALVKLKKVNSLKPTWKTVVRFMAIINSAEKDTINRQSVNDFFEAVKSILDKNYEGASVEFEKFQPQRPLYKDAIYALGECYINMKQPHKAIAYYENLIKLDPKYPDVYIEFGGHDT